MWSRRPQSSEPRRAPRRGRRRWLSRRLRAAHSAGSRAPPTSCCDPESRRDERNNPPRRIQPWLFPGNRATSLVRARARRPSTVSSCGATSCRLPIARPAQPVRLTQRRNDESGSRISASIRVLGRQLDGVARAHVEVDLGLVAPPLRDRGVRGLDLVRVDAARGLELRPHHVAVLVRPAREGGRVRLLASWRNCGHVFAVASGNRASTTRAPSRSRSATHASARSLVSVGRPSPIPGGWRSSPTVSLSSRGSGQASRPAPTRRARRPRRNGPSAPPCRASGRAGRRRPSGSRPSATSGRRSRRRPREAGSSSRCPSRSRGRRARRRVPPRCPSSSRRSSSPAARGCARCRTTRSGRARSRRTRAGSPCRRRPPRRGRPCPRRWRPARGRARRRGASRTSSGSRPCRSGP